MQIHFHYASVDLKCFVISMFYHSPSSPPLCLILTIMTSPAIIPKLATTRKAQTQASLKPEQFESETAPENQLDGMRDCPKDSDSLIPFSSSACLILIMSKFLSTPFSIFLTLFLCLFPSFI